MFCFFMTLSLAIAAIETHKKGGHGLFHGFEDSGGKNSLLEESKVDSVKISGGYTNDLLSNNAMDSKKNSLYLQPEPRGLEYLLNVPDQNPILMNFYRRRREVDKTGDHGKKHVRQINLQRGNIIPASEGQAVLYGFPNGLPIFNTGQQPVLYNQEIPSEIDQHGDFSQGFLAGPNQNDGILQDSVTHYGGYKAYGY